MLLALLLLVPCCLGFQSYDGSDQTSGRINSPLRRVSGFAYDDGISLPRLSSRAGEPSPRAVSNAVFGRFKSGILEDPESTALTIFWGQFLDHDMSITLFNGPENCVEPFDIKVPLGDPRFDPNSEGGKVMHFCRSDFIQGSSPRNQANAITSIIDGSGVYGETEERCRLLRTLQGGLLKTTPGADGDFPPFNRQGDGSSLLMSMINDANVVPTVDLHAIGDLRGNEQPVLFALHTLFVREHNRRARAIAAANATMSDEEIFQSARRWVIGHIQAISLNEWFPAFVGGSLGPYRGHDASVDMSVDAFFTTAALRVGHDGIPGIVLRLDENESEIPEGHLPLRDGFFVPSKTVTTGISATLRGAAYNPGLLMDAVLTDDIRDFLFSMERALASDLGARNLQRGREHGLPGYNAVRRSYGLAACAPTDFSCIAADEGVAAELQRLYASTEDVDAFVGGISERRRPGERIGELFATAIREQLDRLRHGDSFWYENLYAAGSAERAELEATSLGDIIERNSDISGLPRTVMRRQSSPAMQIPSSGTRINFLFENMFAKH